MLRPKSMMKLTVFGPKSHMKLVIEKLYDMNAVHIEDYSRQSEDDIFDIGEPSPENESYSEYLVKIRSLMSNLKVKRIAQVKASQLPLEAIKEKTNQIYEKANALFTKKDYYGRLKEVYEKNLATKSLDSLKLSFSEISGYDASMIYFIGFINSDASLFKEKIESITPNFHLQSGTYNGITLISLFADSKKKHKIIGALEDADFSPIDIPLIKKRFPELKMHPGQKFAKLNYEAEVIDKNAGQVEKDIAKLAEEHSRFLLEAEAKLKAEVEKAEAPMRFATTKSTFLIKGWIATNQSKKLKEELERATSGKVMVKLEKPSKKDNVPTEFNNHRIVKPFEAFMSLYTLPNYREIDPTFFMFLTFPIFFGFMLGDVGYGLITLALFLLLKKKIPSMKYFFNALIIASLSTIVFGMVFGEYFGFEKLPPSVGQALGIQPKISEGNIIYPIPHLFQRSHHISDLLSIALLFGMVHILVGFIIGFINVYKNHGLMHAILEKGGWLLMLPFIVWVILEPLGIISGYVAEMLNSILPPLAALVGMFLLGAVLTIKAEGIIGLIEIIFFQLMSNILSYARLMAVGLASLSLAMIVNQMAGQMVAKMGLIGLIPATLIMILGHTINIVLGILSPFLHSLRLHYVEFFNKFYKGGGKRFKSFGYS